ncbi:MAG: hypothetical protein ABIE23_05365 [archaeon]
MNCKKFFKFSAVKLIGLIVVILLVLSGLFFGFGLSFGNEMKLNCEKYDVAVCHCAGIIHDQGKECLGARFSCTRWLDSCVDV